MNVEAQVDGVLKDLPDIVRSRCDRAAILTALNELGCTSISDLNDMLSEDFEAVKAQISAAAPTVFSVKLKLRLYPMVQADSPEFHIKQEGDGFNGGHWLRGVSLTLFFCFPAVAAAGIHEVGRQTSAIQRDHEHELWYRAWMPVLALGLIFFFVVSSLKGLFGVDQLQERATSSSLKDATKSNFTNQALVNALF